MMQIDNIDKGLKHIFGWVGGWVAGLSEIKASYSQPAELELGLGLAWQ